MSETRTQHPAEAPVRFGECVYHKTHGLINIIGQARTGKFEAVADSKIIYVDRADLSREPWEPAAPAQDAESILKRAEAILGPRETWPPTDDRDRLIAIYEAALSSIKNSGVEDNEFGVVCMARCDLTWDGKWKHDPNCPLDAAFKVREQRKQL